MSNPRLSKIAKKRTSGKTDSTLTIRNPRGSDRSTTSRTPTSQIFNKQPRGGMTPDKLAAAQRGASKTGGSRGDAQRAQSKAAEGAARRKELVKRENLKNKPNMAPKKGGKKKKKIEPHHRKPTAASRGQQYGGRSPYTEPLPEFLTQVKERNHPIYGKLRY